MSAPRVRLLPCRCRILLYRSLDNSCINAREPASKSRAQRGNRSGDERKQKFSDKSQVQVIARAAAILRALEDAGGGPEPRPDRATRRVWRARPCSASSPRSRPRSSLIAASPTGRVRLGPDDPAAGGLGAHRFRGGRAARSWSSCRSELNETVDLADGPEGSSGLHRPGDRLAAAAHGVGGRRDLSALLHRQRQGLSRQLDDAAIARLIGTSYEQRTPNTLTRLERPARGPEDRAARPAVALDREEHTLGICAAGVVLRDPLGNDVAISVPVPAQRFYAPATKLIAERLLATKRALLDEHLGRPRQREQYHRCAAAPLT